MSEVDSNLWWSIVRSKQAIQDARQYWNGLRWIVLGIQAVAAVWSLVAGYGARDADKFLLYAYIVLVLNVVVKIVLSRYELSIAKTEAELAYRLDAANA